MFLILSIKSTEFFIDKRLMITYKLARWLSLKYNSLKKFESSSINNSVDLIDSIPVEKLMKYLAKWLNDIGLQKEEVKDYIELTKICVEQNYFSFTNKFYKQDSGLSMGNPLSPFLQTYS